MQANKEMDDRIAARREEDRVKRENALKERDEAERKDPNLRRARERREREDSEEIERLDRRNGVRPSFGGQSWS